MKPRPNARLVSLANAARELGLAYHTVYELVQRNELKAVRLPGMRSIYLDRRDIEAKLAEWKS